MKLDEITYDKKTGEFMLLDKTSNTKYIVPKTGMAVFILVEIFGMDNETAQKTVDEALSTIGSKSLISSSRI